MTATGQLVRQLDLREVWNDCEEAQANGHLSNISMLAFVACRAIKQRWPELSVSYEAEWQNPHDRHMDLAVCTREKSPQVVLAGLVRPLGETSKAVEQTLSAFKWLVGESGLSIPYQRSGERIAARREVPVANGCEFALLTLAPRPVFDTACQFLATRLVPIEQNRIHFACVVQPIDRQGSSEFIYFEPGTLS